MASSRLLAGHSRRGSDGDFITPDESDSATGNPPAYSYGDPRKADMLDHEYIALRAIPSREPLTNDTAFHGKQVPAATAHRLGPDGFRPWKPYYLRRRFLYGFLILFVVIIATLQALLAISNEQTGLATSFSDLHYLWTYGPTAVLTVIAAVWARVEYQAKLIAPWTRLSKGLGQADRTVLLDYISMFQPRSIFEALRNRDIAVAGIGTVSILLKVIIVISTALITLSSVEITRTNAPVTLESQFVNDPTGLANIGSLPYFTMVGLKQDNITLPDGLSSQYAYQQVSSLLGPTAEVSITVDGFTAGLDCQPASVNVTSLQESSSGPAPHWNLTVTAPQCDMSLYDLAPALNIPLGTDTNFPSYFARFLSGDCANSSDVEDKRIIVMFGRLNYTLIRGTQLIGGHVNNTYELNMFESTQLACTPNYNISKVDIVKNGTELLSISQSSDLQSRILDDVHPWDLMQAHYDSFSNHLATTSGYQQETNISDDTTVDVDTAMKIAFEARTPKPKASSLLEEQFLEDYVNYYWAQYASIMAHNALVQSESKLSTGTALVDEDRLLVRPLAAHLMSGFLGLCILLILTAAYTAPSKGILPRSPGTILGVAALVSHSHDLVANLRQYGSGTIAEISSHLRNSRYHIESSRLTRSSLYPSEPFKVISEPSSQENGSRGLIERREGALRPTEQFFHPTTLSPALRIVIVFLLLGIIASLEATLRTSDSNNGLGDVSDETYIHFLWTTGPAILLSLLGMYFASVDFQIRSMVPFVNMKHYSPSSSSVNLDLLDLFTPHMIYREFRIGHTAALAATVSAFVASFLTVFSGSLFFAESKSTVDITQLQTQGTFVAQSSFIGNVEDQNRDEEASAASLILASNLSYPAFTYEDLVFPQFLLGGNASDDSKQSNSTSIVVDAELPALRSNLSCRMYTESDMTVNFTFGVKDGFTDDTWSPLAINITGEECRPISGNNVLLHAGNSTVSRYFGTGNQADAAQYVEGCSNYLYAWGRLHMETDPPSISAVAMGCNESIESVNVTNSFVGSGLVIDPDDPPVPNNATSDIFVNSSSLIDGETTSVYYFIANITSKTDLLDPFFGHLTTSRYAIPPSYLGDTSQTQAVTDAIRFQHGIIRAQNLNAKFRIDINGTVDITGNDSPEAKERQRKLPLDSAYNATVTDPVGRRRVVQDEASTRVLQALLSATLLFFLLGWGLMRNTDSLPRSPTGLASVVALLADGNLLNHLPPGAELLGDEELEHRAFQNGAMFWMGWGHAGSQTQGVNGDHGKGETFGIWVVERDDNLIEQWEPR